MMEDITLGECFRGSWRDAGDGLLYRPLVTLFVFAALLALGYWVAQLGAFPDASLLRHDGMPQGQLHQSLARIKESLAQGLIGSIFIVYMMRHSLFGGADSGLPPFYKGVFRYLLVCVGVIVITTAAIMIVSLLFGLLLALSHDNIIMGVVVFIMQLGFALFLIAYTSMRIILLLCNAAIGGRASWRSAWNATRGHFWKIAATQLVSGMPLIVVALIAQGVFMAIKIDRGSFEVVICNTLLLMIWLAVFATSTAWLYRRFAAHLD